MSKASTVAFSFPVKTGAQVLAEEDTHVSLQDPFTEGSHVAERGGWAQRTECFMKFL